MSRLEKTIAVLSSMADWILELPFSILFTLLTVLLSPILPLFSFSAPRKRFPFLICFTENEGYLPPWANWFQTPDASLDGDDGWKTQHWLFRFKIPNQFLSTYIGRMGWLIRNPGYGFDWLGPVGAKIEDTMEIVSLGNINVRNRPNGTTGYSFVALFGDHTYWQFTWVMRYFNSNLCLYITLGWKVRTYAEDPSRLKSEPNAMFCFSPRLFASFEA